MHSLLAVFSRPFQSLRRLAAATAATLVASTICTPLGAQASWVQWTAANGGNDHWYLAVRVPGGIAWSGADVAARALGGHLATITSAAENAFVFQLVADPIFWRVVQNPTRIFGPWLGGFQPAGSAEPLGSWTWVTGESWGFTNWAPNEPNNYQGTQEDHLHYFTLGTTPLRRWNDLRETALVPGFVVESPNAPLASYLSLGSNCAIAGQTPTLLPVQTGVDLPRLGSTSTVRVGNLPTGTQIVVLAVGLSNRYAHLGGSPTPLPASLDFLGWTGCTLQVDPEVVVFRVAAGGTVDQVVTIPPANTLIGASFFLQAATVTGSAAAVTATLAGFVGL